MTQTISQQTVEFLLQETPNLFYLFITQQQKLIELNDQLRDHLQITSHQGQHLKEILPELTNQLNKIDLSQIHRKIITTHSNKANTTEIKWLLSRSDRHSDHLQLIGIPNVMQHIIKEEQLLSNIINHIPHHIFWKNKHSVFEGCNQLFADTLGMSDPKQIVGLTDYDMPWTTKQSHKYITDDQTIIRSGLSRLGYEESQTQPDGSTHIKLVSKVALKDESGDATGVLGIYTNITQLKEIEKKLEAAKQAAEKSDQSKSQFLAAVSHELKTPLNGIYGCAQLLLQSKIDDKNKELIRHIYDATRSLSNLVSDILDFSQLESGNFKINFNSFSFKEMVNSAYHQALHHPAAQNLKLIIIHDDTIPDQLMGDTLRLKQLILNLLINAIKFTHKGTVTIQSQVLKKTNKTVTIKVSIVDTGIGIKEELHQSIFNRFTQVPQPNNAHREGVGLGLAIFKQLCQTMNANYGMNSEVGKGSTFWFSLDYPTINQRSQKQPLQRINTEHRLNEYRILVLEDNTLNQLVLRHFFNEHHVTYQIHDTGLEGLSAYKCHHFDLIILDIGLPDISGIQVAQKIRETDNKTPIILLTAYSLKDQRIETRLANAALEKPIDLKQLKKTIIEVLTNS